MLTQNEIKREYILSCLEHWEYLRDNPESVKSTPFKLNLPTAYEHEVNCNCYFCAYAQDFREPGDGECDKCPGKGIMWGEALCLLDENSPYKGWWNGDQSVEVRQAMVDGILKVLEKIEEEIKNESVTLQNP